MIVQAQKIGRLASLAVNIPLCELRYITALFLLSAAILSLACIIVRSTSIIPFLDDTLKFFRVSFSASAGRKDVGTTRVGSMTHVPLTLPFNLEMEIKLLGFGRDEVVDNNGSCGREV